MSNSTESPSSSSTTVTVALQGQPHHYTLTCQRGLLTQHPTGLVEALQQALATSLLGKKCVIVSDEHVWPLYGSHVQTQLEQAGVQTIVYTLPPGEASKTLAQFQQVLQTALGAGLKRSDMILALGGGVVGDLAGFVASSYYRGCVFIQVPTTLLAQVDSSVGGKVAVNASDAHGHLVKNSVGAFYQPHWVGIDPDVLHTLPQREQQAGLAELLKYAFIEQTALRRPPQAETETLWHFFSRASDSWHTATDWLIPTACRIKASVVQYDEREQAAPLDASGRVCLNLGHTFAHAYESQLGAEFGMGSLLHGEAVGWGLVAATLTSHALGLLDDVHTQAIIGVSQRFGLLQRPQEITELPSIESLVASMFHDKKNQTAHEIRLILPSLPIGTVRVVPTQDTALLASVLTKLHSLFKCNEDESTKAKP